MTDTAKRQRTGFERFYSIVVLIKGIDGSIELVLGVLLLLSPQALGTALIVIADEVAEGASPLRTALSSAIESSGHNLAGGAAAFAVFLLVHGVVKLLTVYCLLRRAVRWYPWAIGVLTLLLAAQLTDLAIRPSVGAWVLTVLDVVVIALVAWEYRRLRHQHAAPSPAAPMPVGAPSEER